MKHPVDKCRNTNRVSRTTCRYTSKGFTLIEVMIVMVIMTIVITYAVPTFKSILEKRQLTSAAEEISSFISFTQSEAIKQNKFVTVTWESLGHGDEWCVGASLPPQSMPCNCMETDTTKPGFCSIDGAAFRLVQADFVDEDFEFVHWFPESGNFSFDPVRGIMDNLSSNDILSTTKPLVYFHSSEGTGSSRMYELELDINISGRVDICSDDYRKSIVAGYTKC